jgi:hypothetical protein
MKVTRDLGFIININRSHLVPTRTPTFLEAQLDLIERMATTTEQRVLNLVLCVQILRQTQRAPAVAWLKVLGLMASRVDLVPFCTTGCNTGSTSYKERVLVRSDNSSVVSYINKQAETRSETTSKVQTLCLHIRRIWM